MRLGSGSSVFSCWSFRILFAIWDAVFTDVSATAPAESCSSPWAQ
jgi:hypothetical protein